MCEITQPHGRLLASHRRFQVRPLPLSAALACSQCQGTGCAILTRGPDSSSLCSLSALQELQLDTDPGVRRAALETLKVLDSCSQHWLLASPGGMS